MSSGQRNVVLVTIDSLRADVCGYLGGDRATPTLDALAASGLSFTTAIAPGPNTYSAMPAVFSGRPSCPFPASGGPLEARSTLIARNMRGETIPEWFARQGYATGGFTTNPYTGRHSPFARGFDDYEDFMDGGEGPLMRWAADKPVLSELKHLVTLVRGDRASMSWESYYEKIREWLAATSHPYFLWVFVLDPHTPYLPPPSDERPGRPATYYHNWRLWASKKWGVDWSPDPDALWRLYEGAVAYTDEFLRQLQADLPGDPVLAVHSDHGEAFGEHGHYGHGEQLYEENLHVPLVVSGEGISPRTVEKPISLMELPSLLAGAATGRAHPQPANRRAYALGRTIQGNGIAIRGSDWKYIASLKAESIASETLYDLATDPDETVDVSGDRGTATEACRAIVRRRLHHEREAISIASAAGVMTG